MNSAIAKGLDKNGWVDLLVEDHAALGNRIICLARELGTPVFHRRSQNILHVLTPSRAENAQPNSLSSRHSTGAFPLHVDTAHWTTPCRYVILACAELRHGVRSTTLVDFKAMEILPKEREILHCLPYKVSNGRRSFYGTVLSKDREFIRYDPGCMRPAIKGHHELEQVFAENRIRSQTRKYVWEPGKVLIIDNWRMLHGRGDEETCEQDRTLYRVLVA